MSKVEVKAFKQLYCEKLLDEISLDPSVIENQETFKFDEDYANGSTGIYFDTKVIGDLDLSLGYNERGVNKCDLNNSKLIYHSLTYESGGEKRSLTPLEASDRRIWTYLAFSYLFPYMKKRWSVGDVSKRYFMPGKRNQLRFEYLVRHGVARLWWMAYLVFDKDNKNDPLHLLEPLMSSTDVSVSILERKISHSRKVLIAHLKVINSNSDYQNEDIHRETIKTLLAASGTVELTILSDSELFDQITQIASSKLLK
jgi:hypothetical protein